MSRFLALCLCAMLLACGGDGSPSAPAPVTPPPAPSAVISATGAGPLVLHPSLDSRFVIAMETPIRINETAGGSANWGFARMAIFLDGREVERAELGADVINAAGFGTIAANSSRVYTVVFRFNADDFDRIDITLGFTDRKDGRAFTATVPFGSFTDVQISLTPLSLKRSAVPM